MGELLKTFKADGGLLSDGALDNVNSGCYAFEFDLGGELDSITMKNGAAADVPAIGINRSWKFTGNWNLFETSIAKHPIPPILVCDMFDASKKAGPWAVPNFDKNPDLLHDAIGQAHVDLKSAQTVSSSAAVKATVSNALSKVAATKASENKKKLSIGVAKRLASLKAEDTMDFSAS